MDSSIETASVRIEREERKRRKKKEN